MKKSKLILFLPILIISFAFSPLHHGWANYDQTKGFELNGEIVDFVFENPHAIAKVKTGDGVWTAILAPTSRMTDRGVTVDKLQKGNQFKGFGYPHKKEKFEMRAERIFIGENKFELR